MTHNPSAAKNQREQLLAGFRRTAFNAQHPGGAGRWLALRDIMAMGIAQYGARISELRREGFKIVNFREWSDAEQRYHSWYRLVETVDARNRP